MCNTEYYQLIGIYVNIPIPSSYDQIWSDNWTGDPEMTRRFDGNSRKMADWFRGDLDYVACLLLIKV